MHGPIASMPVSAAVLTGISRSFARSTQARRYRQAGAARAAAMLTPSTAKPINHHEIH